MKTDSVVGVFDSIEQARLAVHILDRAGFAPDHVSLVTQHIDPSSEIGQELALGDDSMHDAAIGATLGGIAGVLSDATVFLVTGIGAVVAAGPLVAVMGAVVGALLGGMDGWGLHTTHIERYESCVRDGKVLVVVNGDPPRVVEAAHMLRDTAATEVHIHAETSDDAPEIAGR